MKLVGTFVIPRVTPSNNKLIRMHWAQRKIEWKMWKDEVFVACTENTIPFATGQRTVEIMSYRRKLCDEDNWYGGIKPLLDALVKLRVIIDDSPKYLILRGTQEIDWKNTRTKVKVWE